MSLSNWTPPEFGADGEYIRALTAKLQAAEAEVEQLKSGIHPAKKPMVGGFSMDKFMADVSPEDAAALGEFLDQMEHRRYIDGYRTGREHNYSNNAKLIDHLEEENTSLRAEVARLTERNHQEIDACCSSEKVQLRNRIAELESGLRRGLSIIEGDPDYRAVEQHFKVLLGEGK